VGIAPAGVTDLAPMRTGALEKTHSVMVFFGSGRLLADANKAASIVNRFYGVYDDGSKIGLTEADLTVQQRTYSTATARVYQNDLKVGYTRSAGSSKRGWYITLPDDGERVIDRALVKGELVYFNTVLPDTSTCDAGGKGWENVVQMANGGSARGAQWDVNQNGSLDAGDTHAGISFAGRKTAQGQPGAPKIIGNVLFSSRAYKVGAVGKEDECKGLDIPVSCGPLASASSSTSGRISWMELQPKEAD
jgi:type IV pilus assembly protein PilY1